MDGAHSAGAGRKNSDAPNSFAVCPGLITLKTRFSIFGVTCSRVYSRSKYPLIRQTIGILTINKSKKEMQIYAKRVYEIENHYKSYDTFARGEIIRLLYVANFTITCAVVMFLRKPRDF